MRTGPDKGSDNGMIPLGRFMPPPMPFVGL